MSAMDRYMARDLAGIRFQHEGLHHGIQPCTIIFESTGQPSRCDIQILLDIIDSLLQERVVQEARSREALEDAAFQKSAKAIRDHERHEAARRAMTGVSR